jgi:formylglycine-generating enzyme required for sulfatase activity
MKQLLLALTLAVSACNDNANQLVVSFDTDAPLPAASGVDPLEGPTPLFDRLRIDVLQPDGTPCSGCSNDFAITSDMFTATEASIGVPLPSGAGWTLRARLYLARFAQAGEPDPDSTIDALVSLPDAADNPGSAGVFLSTDTVGVVATSQSPASLGSVAASSAVGTWQGAKRVACDESGLPRPPNTACVAGGAYWMGTEDGQALSGRSGSWHRLAVLSPHYIDVAEVTVGAFRMSKQQPTGLNDPTSSSGPAYCTFTASPGLYESLPVNCLTVGYARSYCKALGGDLPTAAQFERLATRFGRAPYVWGIDQPTCADAVFSNCSTNECYLGETTPDPCYTVPSPSPLVNASGPLGGPVPAPTCTPDAPCSLRDALAAGDAVVVNLAGNVAEYTADRGFAEDDTCLTGASSNVLLDPACPITTSTTSTTQVRGGAFSGDTFSGLRGDVLLNAVVEAWAADIGFRCAYPATPAM